MAKKKAVSEVVASEPEVRTFTEAELFYITEKCKTTPASEIAKTLKCTEADLVEHLPEGSVAQQSTSAKPKTMMMGLMGGQSRSGKRDGMAVMTPPASQFADATRQTRVQGRVVDCIHRPLG